MIVNRIQNPFSLGPDKVVDSKGHVVVSLQTFLWAYLADSEQPKCSCHYSYLKTLKALQYID